MNASNPMTRLVDDLAALWTEPALEILRAAGATPASVATEIETWHTLAAVLRTELHGQWAFRAATKVSLGTLMERVFRRALARLLDRHNLKSTYASVRHTLQVIRERQTTVAEQRIFGELVRQPAAHGALKPLGRTDFVPRLRLTTNRA